MLESVASLGTSESFCATLGLEEKSQRDGTGRTEIMRNPEPR